MQSTIQILNILKSKKKEMEIKYPISEMGLFGSYARVDQTEKSDINIWVDFSCRIDPFDYIRMAHELEDTFQQKIDVVSRKAIQAKYLTFVEKNLIRI